MSDLSQELFDLLGPKGWLSAHDSVGSVRDWLDRYGEPPLGIARPATTGEVAAVIGACARAGVPVVPQGGNTGLCGAAVCGRAGSVIVSLSRMNAMGKPDTATGSMTVEAGVVLAALHDALEPHDLIFPLHLGAEGTAQIGGLIGTNAGGSHAARYGMMQDLVLGLEVVLADGSIWNGLRAVQKDNAGYQLRKLFCGGEGTLGIVTRAVLKLFPAPKVRETALLAVPDMDALVAVGSLLRKEAGEFLGGLEFFSDFGLDLALANVEGLAMPLESRAPWYLLVEMTAGSSKVPLSEIMQSCLEDGFGQGIVVDGALAMSDTQRAAFWRLREEQPEGQRLEGPQLKHDISVPPGRLAEFIGEAGNLCQDILGGVRINAFGHLGDGNTHYNLSPPAGHPDFADTAPALATALARLATELGGSFAAEHGLGRSKIALADALRPAAERALMGRIKQALDPQGLLNPGVVLAANTSGTIDRNTPNLL
ncbi:FAD-binding oxidoreductase [Pelagibacterium halotolerans]|uniref:D-2-hydroxyglutarate dehydrogenase n=1 Tax=Pelagibacterium halotolerans (strain DSM 22347 / JCM 15775 / CGMCC 1.7692 / B2) TaxID=1082931 RepID=G4RD26_PELHB|nr:FAD-binding oxidoreductase [Pelagibacterium halotolerans]AEQ53776.1 D-2-hydroxyglutarate dehydrogenase [Pelagibacterium halotolerans B2]QJR20065.1 FAD-binding oxidoreductase [Pelagibacterium halotolerans]SEA80794.1 FAD/FMN-containing dehydrogenase [Pelagibacterium halotolerans]